MAGLNFPNLIEAKKVLIFDWNTQAKEGHSGLEMAKIRQNVFIWSKNCY